MSNRDRRMDVTGDEPLQVISVGTRGPQGPATVGAGSVITARDTKIVGNPTGDPVSVPALFNAAAYGAMGDNVTDDLTALQATFDAAFAVGGTVELPHDGYVVSAAITIPSNTAGTIRVIGTGRSRSFTGGSSGDVNAVRGTEIRTTSTTDSVFHSTNSSGSKRVHITLENLTIVGNVSGGTTGHGLHFEAASGSNATIVTLRDVSVIGCKQHGIFADGNVFESQGWNVRSSQNGGQGFKAAANGGGLPGEWRFYGCSFFDGLDSGIDLSGGGHFSFHGVSTTANDVHGLIANGVSLAFFDMQMEINGPSNGNQALLQSCSGAQFHNVTINTVAGSTGAGFKLESCTSCRFLGVDTNSSTGGAGYADFQFDDATSRCTVEDYFPNDGTMRIEYGAYGGHMVRTGNVYATGQTVNTTSQSTAISANVKPDLNLHNEQLVTITGSGGITLTMQWPSINNAYHNGQRIAYEIFNNSSGTVTCNWDAVFHLAGAWVSPAAGKTRRIEFVWNNTRSCFVEQSRSGEIT